MDDAILAARSELAFLKALADDRGALPAVLGWHLIAIGAVFGADFLHIERRRDLGRCGHTDTRFRAALTAPRTVSRRSVLAMSVSASSRKAWINRCRASCSGIPRARR